MTTDERQRLIERLEEAEGLLNQADMAVAFRNSYAAMREIGAAVLEIRAVKRALEEELG
jgi:hypothetical protein